MPTAPEYPPVIPYLTADNAEKAIAFYKAAFDAQELYRLADSTSGRIGHAEISIHNQVVMISDEFPGMSTSPQTLGGVASKMVLMVSDTDAVYKRAIDAGAVSIRPPGDQFYGFRMAVIRDPAGHQWMIQHEIEKVAPEEMQRRWDAMAGTCSGSAES